METPSENPTNAGSKTPTGNKEPPGGSTAVGVTSLNGEGFPVPGMVTGGDGFEHPPGTAPSTWLASPEKGLPTFDPGTTTSVVMVDVNNDEVDDVIVTTTSGQPSLVYLNPGDGKFSEVTPTPIAGTEVITTKSVEVADINGDGHPDLVLGNTGSENHVLLGNPEAPGDFSGATPMPFGPETDETTAVKVADIDNDGALDIIVANRGQENKIYFGTPGTGATPGAASTSGDYSDSDAEVLVGQATDETSSVEVRDLDKDGLVDIVFGNQGTESEIIFNTKASNIREVLPTTTPLSIGSAAMNPQDVKVMDVNNDGYPDIVFANNGVNTVAYGSDRLDYATMTPIGTEDKNSLSVHILDVDSDGNLAVVFGQSDGSVTTHYTEQDDFTRVEHAGGRTTTDVQQLVADFNDDGIADLLTGTQILLGDGTGDFSAVDASTGYASEMPRAVTSMDIDGDGDIDLICSSTSGASKVYALLNPGSGDFSGSEPVTLGGTSSAHRTIAMEPFDANEDGYME